MNHRTEIRTASRRPDDHDSLAAPRTADAPTTLRAFTPGAPQRDSILFDVAVALLVVLCGCGIGFGLTWGVEAFLIAVDAVTGGQTR